MGDTNTQTAPAQPDILNMLLTGGMSSQNSNVLQGLLGLLQPTPNPQQANAALGPSTTNVLNNAAQLTGNPALAAGNYDATQNTGINQQQAVQALQGLTKNMGGVSNQPNAYQKGVNKILQQAGQTHATQALQAGMNPLDIANHSAMQSGNSTQPSQQTSTNQAQPSQSNTQPASINSGSSATVSPQPSILPPTNPFQSPGYNPQTGNVQEAGWVNRGLKGLATGGIPGLLSGLVGPSAGEQMGTIEKAQVLKAGQPSVIAAPQAEAGYNTALSNAVKQKMAGQEPLQPVDIKNIQAGINKLNFDALNASSQRLQEEIDQKQKAKEALQSTINIFGHLSGLFSGSGQTIADGAKKLDTEIDGVTKVKADVDARIAAFTPPQNELSNTNSNQNFVEGAVYKDANGNTTVYHGTGNK